MDSQMQPIHAPEHPPSGGIPFKFQTMSSIPPIRFDPNTPRRSITYSEDSGSPLSSCITPENANTVTKSKSMRIDIPSTSGSQGPNDTSSTLGAEPPSSHITLDMTRTGETQATSDHWVTIEGSQSTASAPYQASHDGRKPPGKLTTQYVMPDGSVITGKGLGRGRPGVKRGPRKSKVPGEDSMESASTTPVQEAIPSAVSVAGKRKRSDSEASNIRARSVSSSLKSRESSVEYNPTATQTRSGRQTQRPLSIAATVAATPSATASPANKKIATTTISTPALKTHPKIKKRLYKGKEQFALCEHCLRGYGPPENVIVFCDACNKCWHQRCHQPQISKELVADTNAEWFCATCDKILHGNKRAKKPAPKPVVHIEPPPEQKFGPPLVGAIALTIDQRKKYLETLSRDRLIGLLLRAGELAPQMPIFETPLPLPRTLYVQPQFTSDYVTPVEKPLPNTIGGAGDVPDEGYDDTYDEHAALYPKVGEGVKLPPEREDLNMLLEGPECRTFSHWVQGLPAKTIVDTVPLHPSQTQAPKPATVTTSETLR